MSQRSDFLCQFIVFQDTYGDFVCRIRRFRDTLGPLVSPMNTKGVACLWPEEFCFTCSMVRENRLRNSIEAL